MRFVSLLAALVMATGSANALTVTPTFTYVGVETGTATETGVWVAELSGLGLSVLGSITVTDDGAGTAGSPGAFSGFDLDALFIDLDGDYNTTGDQFFADSYVFTPGTVRPTTDPAFDSMTSGPLNGMNADGTVDTAFATLNAIDAVFYGPGSLTLGDGGSLSANFDPPVPLGSALYIIAGEVGDNGENITGLVTISDGNVPPLIPLSAGLWFMLGGFGLLGIIARQRRKPI